MSQLKNITLQLGKIYNELMQSPAAYPSLLTGSAGVKLFTCYFSKYFPEKINEAQLCSDIQQFAENSIMAMLPTFCNGEAGKYCFFYHLSTLGLLSKADVDFLCDNDEELKTVSLDMLNNGNYDLLHGATGIAFYFLFSSRYSKTDKEKYFDPFFNSLLTLCKRSKFETVLPYLDLDTFTIVPEKVNIGLAHGLPGILKLCMQAYRNDVCSGKAKFLAEKIIDFLLAAIQSGAASRFPNFIRYNTSETEMSRLAWCYGDPGVAIILYQAGKVFDNNDLEKKSLEILLFNAYRRDNKSTGITDASLCHGSAGVAYIYSKMYYYTHLTEFREARDFWVQQTLAYSVFEDSISGYKSYYTPQKKFVHDNSLLSGTAGIGLSLLSCLTNDYSWDFCLLLND
jgi:lantibiotic biosynthesis protein